MALFTKRETRRSVQSNAWVTLEGGFAGRPCLVVNLSATGAKIQVEGLAPNAARLKLGFSRDASLGRMCDIVWRRGETLGVRFV